MWRGEFGFHYIRCFESFLKTFSTIWDPARKRARDPSAKSTLMREGAPKSSKIQHFWPVFPNVVSRLCSAGFYRPQKKPAHTRFKRVCYVQNASFSKRAWRFKINIDERGGRNPFLNSQHVAHGEHFCSTCATFSSPCATFFATWAARVALSAAEGALLAAHVLPPQGSTE